MAAITRFGLAPRRPGLTTAEFQAHWAGRHADLVRPLAPRRYWQNHAVLAGDEPLLPWPGFDACSEIDFESFVEIDRFFSSRQYQGPIRDDESHLVDIAQGGSILTERSFAEGEFSGVRLLSFLRVAPLRSISEAAEALQAGGLAAAATGRELFVTLTGRAAAQRISVFDLIEALWFPSADLALQFVGSKESRLQRAAVAGLIRGCDRLIAKVNVVV